MSKLLFLFVEHGPNSTLAEFDWFLSDKFAELAGMRCKEKDPPPTDI